MAGKRGMKNPPRDLQDMRSVYLGRVTEKSATTPGQKMYVDMMRDDPQKFGEVKRELEAKWFATTGKVKPADPQPVVQTAQEPVVLDEGEERARGLLDMLDDIEMECSVCQQVGSSVGEAWPLLSVEDQETIIAKVDAALRRAPRARYSEKRKLLSDCLRHIEETGCPITDDTDINT